MKGLKTILLFPYSIMFAIIQKTYIISLRTFQKDNFQTKIYQIFISIPKHDIHTKICKANHHGEYPELF